MAGARKRCKVWRFEELTDDRVGGANVTGSVVYDNIPLHLQADKPDRLLLQQGYETIKTFTATRLPGTLTIYEHDEIEITRPFDDPYFGVRFRVIGVQYLAFNLRDPRNSVTLSLDRSVRAHTVQ